MIDWLLDALNATGIPFVFMAWSSSPDNSDYGVVTMADQDAFKSDSDPISEKMLSGYVDVFTRDTTSDTMNAVESVLRGLAWFDLESVQYENDTGYTHYEWRWTDTQGRSELRKVQYVMHEKTVTQYLSKGETPSEPPLDGYQDSGLRYIRTGWTQDGDVYTAVYNIFGYLRPGKKVYNGIGSDENGLPTSYRSWNTTNIEEFRTRTLTQGERAKAIFWGHDYSVPYALFINATGYDGEIIRGIEIGDVSFVVV